MSSPASSEMREVSGASARSLRPEEGEPRHEPEVSSSNNGDGDETVAEEEEVPEQGRAEGSKASQEKKKKKEGPPKGRWLPPQIRQDHIDQLTGNSALTAGTGSPKKTMFRLSQRRGSWWSSRPCLIARSPSRLQSS